MGRAWVLSPSVRADLVADYESGESSIAISRKYGIDTSTVLYHLRASGVEMRRQSSQRGLCSECQKRTARATGMCDPCERRAVYKPHPRQRGTCSIPNCGEPHHANGYCSSHNVKLYRLKKVKHHASTTNHTGTDRQS